MLSQDQLLLCTTSCLAIVALSKTNSRSTSLTGISAPKTLWLLLVCNEVLVFEGFNSQIIVRC